MKLQILFEDNHLLVCVKPPGVLSQKSDKPLPDMLTEIKTYLKEKYAKPGNVFVGLVHRLDLNVGGIMVFARTSKAASRLSEAIREGRFQKSYLALVEGTGFPLNQEMTLIDHLEKDPEDRIATPDVRGKTALLKFQAITTVSWKNLPATLLDITLETGRFHQIRVQFASRGHALLNDRKYGAKAILKTNDIGLWAYQLQFPHPISQEKCSFMAKPEGVLFTPYEKSIEQHISNKRKKQETLTHDYDRNQS